MDNKDSIEQNRQGKINFDVQEEQHIDLVEIKDLNLMNGHQLEINGNNDSNEKIDLLTFLKEMDDTEIIEEKELNMNNENGLYTTTTVRTSNTVFPSDNENNIDDDDEEDEDEEENQRQIQDAKLLRKLRKSDSLKLLKIKQANSELQEEKNRKFVEVEDRDSSGMTNEKYTEYLKQTFSGEGLSWFLVDIALVMRHSIIGQTFLHGDTQFDYKNIKDSDFETVETINLSIKGRDRSVNVIYHAPLVFLYIQKIMNIDYGELLISWSNNVMYQERVKERTYIYTHNRKYFAYSIDKKVFTNYLKIMKDYFKYIQENKNTLLPKIINMAIVNYSGRKLYYIFCKNPIISTMPIDEIFEINNKLGKRSGYSKSEDLMGEFLQYNIENLPDPKTQSPKVNLSPELNKLFYENYERDLKFLCDGGFAKFNFVIGVRKGEKIKEVPQEQPIKIKAPHIVMFCTQDKKEITKLKKSKKKQVPSPLPKRTNSLTKVILLEDNPNSVFQKDEYGIFVPEGDGGPFVCYLGFLDLGCYPNGFKQSKLKKIEQYSNEISNLLHFSVKNPSK